MNYYDVAEKNNINVLNANIDANGYYININNKPTIVLNNKLNEHEEQLTLAEEIAHYYVGATPTLPFANDYYNRLVRSKNEFKAFKWLQGNLLPIGVEKLKYDTLWELSDSLELPIEFVEKAIKYRKENLYGQSS